MGSSLLAAILAAGVSLPTEEGDASDRTESEEPDATAEAFNIDIQEALAKKQSWSEQASSAILTSATVSDIRLRGYPTLAEYLNDEVPGFRYAPAFYHRWPNVRGLSGGANLLINGVSATSPIDYRFASNEALFLEEFDLVEAISGPAGVPWGGYSLLGVVNLLVEGNAPDETTLNAEYGTRNHQRLSVRDVRTIGDAKLRLFLGYAGLHGDPGQPTWQYDGVPPYSRTYNGGRSSARLTPSLDLFGVFSAHYSRPKLDVYLRLPYAKEHYQISEFGGVLPAGYEGQRTNVDAISFISWHDAFLSGRLALLARAVWYRFSERFNHVLFAPSTETNGAVSVQELDMSRFVLMSEATYRFQWNRFSADLMGGVDSSLEVPHSSRFYRSDKRYSRVVFDDGPMFRADELARQGSAYVFSEARFSPISIAGGWRYNFSNEYKSISVGQFNAAARFLGDNYLKFGFTQGMRPPTLLDRAGLMPVRGISTLKPERSQAYQVEINSAFSVPGLVKRGFVRADYAFTTLESTIIREENLTAPFLSTPLPLKPSNITTWEALAQLEFYLPLKVIVAYTNTVFRAPMWDQPTAIGIEPNRGPTHHGTFLTPYDVLGAVTVQPGLEIQCGGAWRVVYPEANVARTYPGDPETLGCYYFVNTSIRVPSRPRGFTFMITLRNLLDARPPPASFLFPAIQGAEVPMQQLRGRTIFASFQWSPWGGDL